MPAQSRQLQSRLLVAAGAVLVGAATFTAYHDGDTWSVVLLLVATVALAVSACLPTGGQRGSGLFLPLRAPGGRAQRILLALALAALTVGGVVDAVRGDPQLALITGGALAVALASWRAAPAPGDGDAQVDGASGPPAQQRPVQQRDEDTVE